MVNLALKVLLVALAWTYGTFEGLVEVGPVSAVRDAPVPPTLRKDDPRDQVLEGRVVDGLGRPVSGVKVTVRSGRPREDKPADAIFSTGADGRYSGILPRKNGDVELSFEKDGHSNLHVTARSGHQNINLNRKIRWEEISILPHMKADEIDSGLREVVTSEEWEVEDEKLIGFLFEQQDRLRPGFRRLVSDTHLGKRVRSWLDVVGDPGDHDLFPEGRQTAPKHEVKEIDLVDAIKATARPLNFFSSKAKPEIDVDFIAFTKDMDRVLVQCGINRVALTGITWRFVFQKVDKHWILRSMQHAGNS